LDGQRRVEEDGHFHKDKVTDGNLEQGILFYSRIEEQLAWSTEIEVEDQLTS
jgi:hypothetical protein